MNRPRVWDLLKQTFSECSEDSVSRLAASLAYYTVFSIAPLLVIAIRIAAVVFGAKAARGEVSGQLRGLMGPQTAQAVEAMLRKAAAPGSGGRLATVLGAAFFLYAAANLFAELRNSMNAIWDVELMPNASWWAAIRRWCMALAMVLGTGILLIASLVIGAALAAAGRHIANGADPLARAIGLIASVIVSTLLFATIFKLLPDARIRWKDVWIGAGVTAGLFTAGKYLIGLYLARSTLTSVYGAAGSVAVLLIWVYYSAQVLFLGAEFTQVYARRHGRRIEPAPNAVSAMQGAGARPRQNDDEHQNTDQNIHRGTEPSGASGYPSYRLSFGALIVGFAVGWFTGSRRRVRIGSG